MVESRSKYGGHGLPHLTRFPLLFCGANNYLGCIYGDTKEKSPAP